MKAITVIAAAAAAFIALPAVAADSSSPKPPAKVATVCGACHGVDGVAKMKQYPDLAGQYKDYIEQALREYQIGERVSPIMTPMAKPLTAKQIENIATWYSRQKPAVYTPDANEPFVPKTKAETGGK